MPTTVLVRADEVIEIEPPRPLCRHRRFSSRAGPPAS